MLWSAIELDRNTIDTVNQPTNKRIKQILYINYNVIFSVFFIRVFYTQKTGDIIPLASTDKAVLS